jgi:hypothetical protein
MRARIDITEVESATKIRARYLRAIENEEWDALPGPVYIKSFLRTYADYLGLDSRLLVDEFKRRYERPGEYEPRSVAALHRERERAARGPLVPNWLVIAIVLVAVVVALGIVGSMGKNKPTPATTATHPLVTRKPPAHPKHHRVRPVVRTRVTLELVPTAQVYVCLVDGTGKKLIPGQIFNVGQTIPTESADKLLLTLGNNGVTMKVNGKPVTVPASASSIGYRLTPTGMTPLPPSKQPTCA